MRVRRLTIAVDVGLVVNPDGVVNQIEGGALQALSWTTKEQVRFDARTVTSRTWEDYPILTFSEVPPVDVVLLDRPGDAVAGRGGGLDRPDRGGHRQRAVRRDRAAGPQPAPHRRRTSSRRWTPRRADGRPSLGCAE